MSTSIIFNFSDNMPVTWCYGLINNEIFCNRGFPMGCYMTGVASVDDLCTYLVGVRLRLKYYNIKFHVC